MGGTLVEGGGAPLSVTGGDRVHGGDQLLGSRSLEQEACGSGAQIAEDVVVLLEGREDQDAYVGATRASSRVAAIPSRNRACGRPMRTTSG
jgi:hypothetical protein